MRLGGLAHGHRPVDPDYSVTRFLQITVDAAFATSDIEGNPPRIGNEGQEVLPVESRVAVRLAWISYPGDPLFRMLVPPITKHGDLIIRGHGGYLIVRREHSQLSHQEGLMSVR